MPFIDAESLYFILSIIGLTAVGIMYIWRSGRNYRDLEIGNTNNHECIIKLENKLDDHKKEVDKISTEIKTELKDINKNVSALVAKSEAADKLHDKIWDLLIKEIDKEKLPIADQGSI